MTSSVLGMESKRLICTRGLGGGGGLARESELGDLIAGDLGPAEDACRRNRKSRDELWPVAKFLFDSMRSRIPLPPPAAIYIPSSERFVPRSPIRKRGSGRSRDERATCATRYMLDCLIFRGIRGAGVSIKGEKNSDDKFSESN